MDSVLEIIQDRTLTYEQKVLSLAREAENTLNVLSIPDSVQVLRDQGVICDLFEGNAPYRPRYIVPDYEKFMEEGSSFLGLAPAEDLEDAINNLMILYRHVPSITSFPVYIGNLDKLLEPYIDDEEKAYKAIKRLLTYIDRTITDSFCHGNIGPEDTRAGRLILRAERELQDSIPNLTLKMSKDTPDDLVTDAVETALVTAKPSFAHHEQFSSEFADGDYGIVSCYNGLYIGGGAHTLVRMNLKKLAEQTDSLDQFMSELLPNAAKQMLHYMDERVRFLLEDSGFFESSFLVREGFIHKDRFTSMFGMVGLAETVNHFVASEDLSTHFGHSKEADQLGVKIVEALYEIVQAHDNPMIKATKGKYLLHAQVGIDTDEGSSPGCRIPIGQEPEIHDHLLQAGQFHGYFPSGIGDIFKFDDMAKKNPSYVLDIIKGAFHSGLRYVSLYSASSDVIRITGYLVKRSEIEKLQRGEQVLRDTVALGRGSVEKQRILDRAKREV